MQITKLITASLLLSQSLLFSLPQPGNAQRSCQGTVNNVVSQIRAKGIPEVQVRVLPGEADKYQRGNPTNRDDRLNILMNPRFGDNSSYVARNILNSGQLMNAWANSIVRACGNTAVVLFGVYGSGLFAEYAVQSETETELRYCPDDFTSRDVLNWNETPCP